MTAFFMLLLPHWLTSPRPIVNGRATPCLYTATRNSLSESSYLCDHKSNLRSAGAPMNVRDYARTGFWLCLFFVCAFAVVRGLVALMDLIV